jgi:hypothetical protein
MIHVGMPVHVGCTAYWLPCWLLCIDIVQQLLLESRRTGVIESPVHPSML